MSFATIVAMAALAAAPHPGSLRPALKIDQATLAKVTDGVDYAFRQLWPDYPAEPVGVTQFIYIKGYGAVLAGKLNIAPGISVTPFHQEIRKSDIARTKSKKTERMPALKTAMQDVLLKSAALLRDVPDNEEVVLGVSLFYWHWEDRAGLPDQIVMHGKKGALLAAGKDAGALKGALTMDEF